MSQSPPPIQLVIGMHRSGTSVLTKMLSLLGMDLGRSLMPPSHDNPRGFWENERVIEAHDRLLGKFNRDWSTAALIDKKWVQSSDARQTVSELVDIIKDDFQPGAPILIKDPRICVLYPLWERVAKVLKRPLNIVAIVRSPTAISSSIQKRNIVEKETADFIALSQMQAMNLCLPKKVERFVVYEKFIESDAKALLSEFAPAAVLDPNMTNAVGSLFFSNKDKNPNDQRQHDSYSKVLPQTGFHIDRSTFENFIRKEAARKNHQTQIKKYQNSKTLLGGDAHLIQIEARKLDKLELRLTELEGGIDERNSILKTLYNKIDGKDVKIGALEDGVKERNSKLRKLRKEAKSLNEKIGALEDGVSERESKLKKLYLNVGALEGGLKERDAKLRKLRKDAKSLNQRIGALEGGIVERESTLKKLRSNLTKSETKIGALEGGIVERDGAIIKMRDEREHQELMAQLETQRSAQIERQLNDQLTDTKIRLHYYQTYPVRAGAKSVLFKSLSFLRHKLPLPETLKSGISVKLTGLARRLKGPAAPSVDPNQTPPETPSLDLDFSFEETDAPLISIVVPVYNEIGQTIACLKSIYQQRINVPYEVILADDCSPDPFHTALNQIKGLRVFRNPENLGFLGNCNANAKHARGDFIIFLNNDTLVDAGWMQALYNTYLEHDNVGIVGSKLVFPSGELQEAGGIIWEDASGWNWGRGESPEHPKYNYVRDADYVSGASFMIRTNIFEEIGGFFTGLEKAYYEDTDCCFRVRELGYRVLYQPQSSLTHIEGLSSGTDVTTGAKQYQLTNQKIFFETWKHVLKNHHPNADRPEIASDRTVKGHVLYVDTVTPERDKDAGSVNAFYSMQLLTELGYRVHFVPGTNFAHWGQATKDLQNIGVECIYHPFYSNMESFLKERGNNFDHVILSRAEINEMFLKLIRKKCPRARIINNTVDLHYLRLEREAELSKNPQIALAASEMKKKELAIMKNTDATILLSGHEHKLLSQQKGLKNKLWNVPLIQPVSKRLVSFKKTKNIVFIGGYNHPPNIDAVEWLVHKVWPEMRKQLPDVKLIICGSAMPDHFKDYASDDIIIEGFVPDLNALLAATRLTIAPLRFGAGLKGKVTSSIGVGVPCLGTPIAYEGMEETGLDAVRLEAKTPKQFAALAKSVYFDQKTWDKTSKAGVKYYNDNFAYTSVSKTVDKMLKALTSK